MRFRIQLLALTIVLGLFSCDANTDGATDNQFTIQVNSKDNVAKTNIRGLFLVNDSIGWASGFGGTFLRMTDGENWTSDTIADYTHLDFRDVHGFDANTALLMAAGNEGRILRTEDGGVSWTEVYTRLDSGIFLDGMDFHKNIGYCYGDPIDGKFVLIETNDYGKTWVDMPSEKLPSALPGEAGFAASGTGLIVISTDRVEFVTGGETNSRLLSHLGNNSHWTSFPFGLRSGEGCGGFSLAYTGDTYVAVGGCYLDSLNPSQTCAVLAKRKSRSKSLTLREDQEVIVPVSITPINLICY